MFGQPPSGHLGWTGPGAAEGVRLLPHRPSHLRSESGPGRGGRALQAGQRLNGLRLPGYESIRVRFGLGVVERARLPPR